MPLFRPSELRQFLEELGISPKKGLSQNFLVDGNVLKRIVSCAHVTPGDLVVEIGPGPGALTEQLLEAGAHVTAVEKDRTLGGVLGRLAPGAKSDQLDVIIADVMDVDLAGLIPEGSKGKVIANLPYQLTTPILENLIPLHESYSSITVMVQEEVARRMAAGPGSKTFGSLSVFLQFYADVSYMFGVKRSCFYPVPNVDSAVVQLNPHPPRHVPSEAAFFKMTRTAFQQRRKVLRKTLRPLYDDKVISHAFEKLGLGSEIRPEQLGVQQWIDLHWALEPTNG